MSILCTVEYVGRRLSLLAILIAAPAFGADSGILNFLGPPYSQQDFVEGTTNNDVAGAELIVWWNQLEPQDDNFDFSFIEEFVEAWSAVHKDVIIRVSTAHEILNRTPQWLFDDYNVRRIFDGAWSSFETGLDGYTTLNGAARTNTPSHVVNRDWSVYGENAGSGLLDILSYNFGGTTANADYTCQFDYKAVDAGTYRVQFRTASGGSAQTKEFVFTAAAGETGSKSFTVTLGFQSDYVLYYAIDGPGKIAIDNVNTRRVRVNGQDDLELGLPNYFDPTFQAEWTELVQELSARYNNDPRVDEFAIGGWGRWEELTLDLDFTDTFVDQWQSFGYSDSAYYAHMQWAVDLWEQAMPNKLLHSNTGFVHPTPAMADSEFFWWRWPGYVATQGHYIKHNGLSEMSGTWNPESAIIHWVYDRNRDNPNTRMILETGGQMFNNFLNVTGHPISLLNRAMIDGTDYLYLYPSDLKVRNIQKYMHYVHEQIGRPLWTTMYCRLGDYSMVNPEHSQSQITYNNLWLGVQEFWIDTNTWDLNSRLTTYTTRGGEKCAATNANWPTLIFNVDERQQYRGMYGGILGVEYFDEGTDTFDLSRWNNETSAQETFATINKTNTNTWKWAFFHGTDWLNTARNSGADVLTDVVVDSNGDGHEYIRTIELQFVPAREWSRSLVQSSEPTSAHTALAGTATRDFTLPAGETISFVSIPLWAGDLQENCVTANIYRQIGAGYVLAASKEYAFPLDGDWLEVPLPNTGETDTYRIELTNATGSVGYYQDGGGQIAYRAYQYDTSAAPGSIAADGAMAISGSDSQTVPVTDHFFGAWLPVNVPSGTADISISVARVLPDNSVAATIHQASYTGLSGSQDLPFYFEPQPAGRYQFTVSEDAGDVEWRTQSGTAIVEQMTLNRLQTARKRTKVGADNALYRWDFDTNGSLEGWTADAGLSGATVSGGLLEATVQSMNPTLTSPGNLGITATNSQYVGFSIRNTTGAAMARLQWSDGSKAFDSSNAVWIPIVPNDTEIRDYYYPMGTENGWSGTVNEIRITPVTGMTDVGTIAIDSIVIASDGAYAGGLDPDGDGLTTDEEELFGSNPQSADTDLDGYTDLEEISYDGDAETYDPYHPVNNPGGLDLNVLVADTDGDGVSDGLERNFGTSPIDPGDVQQLPLGLRSSVLIGLLLFLAATIAVRRSRWSKLT